jgi:hypothetical protein
MLRKLALSVLLLGACWADEESKVCGRARHLNSCQSQQAVARAPGRAPR